MCDGRKRVLIVDDDELVQSILERVVEHVGAETVTVDSVGAAVAVIKDDPHFDLILLDLIMPVETGWQLLDRLDAEFNMAHVPVIAVTGVQLSKEESKKLSNRTCAVIRKGDFDVAHMKAMVGKLLKVDK